MSLMVDLRNKVDTKNQKVSSDDSSKTEQLGLKDIQTQQDKLYGTKFDTS